MIIILQDDDGQRLDRYLKKVFPSLTFGETQKLIRTGQIRINGKRIKHDTRLQTGDEMRLPPSLQNNDQNAPKVHFSQKDHDFIASIILYEDSDILVLNKPAGLAVQGGSKTKRHLDGMLNSYQKKGIKPRLCHRLDKDTSGVLILGKTASSTRFITEQFHSHNAKKTYWALCTPAPEQNNGTINAPLSKIPGRHDGGEMMGHDPHSGKSAITDFEVLDRAGKEVAFVAFYPQTGRTHQIRVHAAVIGAPLLGDYKYNPTPAPFDYDSLYDGLHLHARALNIKHPQTKEPMNFVAELPNIFLKSWKALGFHV